MSTRMDTSTISKYHMEMHSYANADIVCNFSKLRWSFQSTLTLIKGIFKAKQQKKQKSLMSLLQKINLFLDEEKKPADDISNGRPKDLLSLVQGGVHVSRRIATKHMPSNFPFRIPELVDRQVISNLTSPGIENSEEWCNVNDVKPAIGPALLTCEDFEKSILSESTEIYPNFLLL
ncbi:Uncharacterized protein TCM_005589 isoform 2 [Theobroma cacao]|uniref:Uncharacterized protein isoform 2 n=1 Tax=Theobroma cacao TaxID=3641 RepID=A0A061DW75_THECC|nr:Uncharacterized protein TCM_005589 isoform 2 [Theobroma cacao]